jgi:hypothetical protein
VMAAHSPDLTLSNFHLFFHLNKHQSSQKFHEDKEEENDVTMWLHVQAAVFYNIVIQKLVLSLNKYLDKCGDYFGKNLKVHVKNFVNEYLSNNFMVFLRLLSVCST